MEASPRPLELILARNLLASLATAAFLVDASGAVAFYNDAAGALLGRRFEESGPMAELPLAQPLPADRPAHDLTTVRDEAGTAHPVAVTALLLEGAGGHRGAIVVLWPAGAVAA